MKWLCFVCSKIMLLVKSKIINGRHHIIAYLTPFFHEPVLLRQLSLVSFWIFGGKKIDLKIVFLPLFQNHRYALVNLLLIVGAKKEIKSLILLWIFFTLGFLIWSFVLVSIMFSYDTTPNFVAGVGMAQLCNFCISAR